MVCRYLARLINAGILVVHWYCSARDLCIYRRRSYTCSMALQHSCSHNPCAKRFGVAGKWHHWRIL